MENLYEALEAEVLPCLEAYTEDLTKHDRRFIEENPGMPFLHYTRNYGTTIIPLRGPETFPARGVSIPYLFGHADREHLLNDGIIGMAEWHNKPMNGLFVCRYFTGQTLRTITTEYAVKVAKRHAKYVRANWDK